MESGRTHLAVTAPEQAAWDRDGFFIRPAVFSEQEIEVLRDAAEKAVALAESAVAAGEVREDYRIDGNRYVEATGSTVQFEHREQARTLRVIEPFHHFDPRFERLLDDPRIVEPMKDLVGSERVSVWTDKLNLKRPREGSQFRFHQDSPYWTHACRHVDRLPNVMVALDDADESNGCLRVVAGSHRQGCLPGIQDGSVLGPLFTDPAFFDASRQVPAVMPAGSLLFFSPHTVHGSEPNTSNRPRRAMVLTYQPADCPHFKTGRVRNAGA
jgi:ectoine hydroxylase-related dioxygenase (phytanoyl-CoA dioxygenase family)